MPIQNSHLRILIIKPSALGDVVHSLAFLKEIKQNFPNSEVHWIISRGLKDLLETHPMINHLWIINKDDWKNPLRMRNTFGELRWLYRGLKNHSYDLVIDLQGLLRSGLMAWVTRAPIRIGFKEAREGSPICYTHRVNGGREIHAVDRYLKVIKYLGFEPGNTGFPFPEFKERSSLIGMLPKNYAVVAPAAGKDANMWPAERFGELVARLPLPSVIICGKNDKAIAKRVVELSRGKAVSMGGETDLKDLTIIIRRASFLISNDTGPMHIAAAFKKPVVAIFGPANPTRTGPYGKNHVIIREDLSCSPCYRKKKCRDWRCMENIQVDQVYEAINKRFF